MVVNSWGRTCYLTGLRSHSSVQVLDQEWLQQSYRYSSADSNGIVPSRCCNVVVQNTREWRNSRGNQGSISSAHVNLVSQETHKLWRLAKLPVRLGINNVVFFLTMKSRVGMEFLTGHLSRLQLSRRGFYPRIWLVDNTRLSACLLAVTPACWSRHSTWWTVP